MFCQSRISNSDSRTDNVLALLLRSVATVPDKVAVREGDSSFTFVQLLACAYQNATTVRGLGVASGEIVLCSIDRGLALPLAWLTTMLAGCVLVPIDRKWPSECLRYIVDLTGARIVLTSHGNDSAPLPGLLDLSVHVGKDGAPVDPRAIFIPEHNPTMYGFFTSGSTGVPKCALNHHAGVANRLNYMTSRFGSSNVVLQNSSHLFDSSIWQILWPLVSQGTLIVASERRPADVEYSVELIERYGVTMTDFVPSIFRLLVRALKSGKIDAGRLVSLRSLIIGGEEMDPVAVRDFMELLPDVKLVNTYGHTEASIGMVFHEVVPPVGNSIALGKPIDNTYVRICDEQLAICEDGAIGEVVVGGVCVGNGYLGQPELTAQVFVSNPFPDVPGQTVYRTGDMGCISEHGLLEYHGRKDNQIKIRGVRVELGGIEYIVRDAFGADVDALATTFRTESGDLAIGLAYAAAFPLPESEVIKALKRRLPVSHAPKTVLQLERIPLTPNGKMDRKRLAQLLHSTTVVEGGNDAPLEQKLMIAFEAHLLSVKVGPETHFFENGGDSLDAVNLTAYLERRFGLEIEVAKLYRHPTPRLLAGSIESGLGTAGEDAEVLPSYQGEPFPSAPHVVPQHILMTGATGFLGVHVLHEVLRSSDALVSLIVRADNADSAAGRLATAAAAAGLDFTPYRRRLRILPGDLAQTRLGCSEQDWEQLEREIDTAFHAGAEVNFLLTYDQLRKPNVQATSELIRLCANGRPKRLHYVSSLVARKFDALHPFAPERRLAIHELRAAGADGYAVTKVASERLLRGAAEVGLDVSIYRLNDVLPSMTTGASNQRSLIQRFFGVCYRHRIAPQAVGGISSLTVDRAAAYFADVVHTRPFTAAGMTMPYVVDVMEQSVVDIAQLFQAIHVNGCEFERVSYREFIERLAASDDSQARLISAVLPVPAAANDIFGVRVDDPASAWSGDYQTLAVAFTKDSLHFEA
jgi:amino acid adenylation domain-containing protein/thioester reductase-like protein